MPTIATTEAFIVDGVATSALEQRLYDTAMFAGDGSNNGVRGGIAYHGSTSLGVTVNGSDQVTVQAGAVVIPAGTGQGVWRGTLAAATSAVALTARNSTNPRIDLVVAQATGTTLVIKTIDGTPAASPVAPALPAQHIELARLTVPQVAGGAVTVDSSWRTLVNSHGGTLKVPTAARLPGSGNTIGDAAVALDTGFEHQWNGTAWEFNEFRQPVALTSGQVSSGLAIAAGVRLITLAGTFTGVTDGAGDLGHTFPVAFPLGMLAVIPILGDPVGVPTAKYVSSLVANKTRFGFAVRVYNSAGTGLATTNVRIDYIALGW